MFASVLKWSIGKDTAMKERTSSLDFLWRLVGIECDELLNWMQSSVHIRPSICLPSLCLSYLPQSYQRAHSWQAPRVSSRAHMFVSKKHAHVRHFLAEERDVSVRPKRENEARREGKENSGRLEESTWALMALHSPYTKRSLKEAQRNWGPFPGTYTSSKSNGNFTKMSVLWGPTK